VKTLLKPCGKSRELDDVVQFQPEETMNILKMLEKEEKKMAGRLEGLRAAISALNGAGDGRKSGRRKGWTMSAEARAKISRAQKARWRKKKNKA
jgi:hypothetical protein